MSHKQCTTSFIASESDMSTPSSLAQDPTEMEPIVSLPGQQLPSPSPSDSPPLRRAARDSPELPRRKPYTLADLNIPKPQRKIVSTFFGTIRTISTITRMEWAYLVISLMALFASVCLTIERIVFLRHEHFNYTNSSSAQDEHSSHMDIVNADYTFAILLLWTAAWSIYHVIVGILSERPYDLIVFMFTTTIVWIYVTINFLQADQLLIGKLIRFIITTVVVPPTLIMGALICKRYFESRTLIFYTVGANEQLQEMFSQLLIHDSFLKLDVQLGGSVLILWVQNSFIENQPDMLEVIVMSVGSLITIVWVSQAYLAIRLENMYLVYSFYAWSWLEPAAVIWNLVRVPLLAHLARSLILSAYAVGIVALASRLASLYTMHIVSKNFGKGLKAKIFKFSTEESNPPA